MKNFLILIPFLLFMVYNTQAQNDSTSQKHTDFYQKAMNHYIISLNHQNAGVVESAIIYLMKIKRECPELSYETATSKLKILEDDGETTEVKLLAHIACRYLDNTNGYTLFSELNESEANQFINILTNRQN